VSEQAPSWKIARNAEIAPLEALDKLGLVEVIVDLAVDEILELVRTREVIDRDDAVFTALIERLHEIAADKAGRAGDDEGHDDPAVMGFAWDRSKCFAPTPIDSSVDASRVPLLRR